MSRRTLRHRVLRPARPGPPWTRRRSRAKASAYPRHGSGAPHVRRVGEVVA